MSLFFSRTSQPMVMSLFVACCFGVIAAVETSLVAFTIRCADPECKLCLAIPGAVSPNQIDTREPRQRPEDESFGGTASLAIVNPVFRSPHQSVLSLRGDWEFRTDPESAGRHDDWMAPDAQWTNTCQMPVPGNWESNGIGEPGMSTPWNCSWDNIQRPLRSIYIGSAWYRRNVSTPKDWSGKRIWLKVGGVRAQAWFWIDGKPVAHAAPYCGAFRYDITDVVQPGKEITIVALVRNDVPSRTGCVSACHTWGGFSRDIELEATPSIHLANVECFGRFDDKSVDVRLELSHPEKGTHAPIDLEIDVHLLDSSGPTKIGRRVGTVHKRLRLNDGTTSEFTETISLADFRAWSPEQPQLYLADVKLVGTDGKVVYHGWRERFGVKKFEVRGKQFFLNDKPYFLRGYGDDAIYPETFISPADRDFHRKNLEVVRQCGFVYVRHHTHCELPEYYDAADELGIMIQPELPYYPYAGFHATENFDFDPKRDLAEVIDHYRRHVATAAFSMGNEGHLGTPLDNELKEMVHRRAAGCLAMHNDGGFNTPENSDFDSPNTACNPLHRATTIVPWKPGDFAELPFPFVAHEYMNLGLKFDPRLSHRFTGAILPPRPMDRFEKRLASFGIDRAWGDACLDAGHALQKHYQKVGIESARLDPDCDGFSFWTIIDVIVRYGNDDEYTGQGIFNPFYEQKPGGVTPEELLRMNGRTVILIVPHKSEPILVAGEQVRCDLLVSHFGDKPLAPAVVDWTFKSGETVLGTGRLEHSVTLGEVRKVGEIEWTVPQVIRPNALTLEANLVGTDIDNSWQFWAFPQQEKRPLIGVAVTPDLLETLSNRYDGLTVAGTPEAETADIVVGRTTHPEMLKAIIAQKRVLALGEAGGPPNVALGWWWIGDQTGTAFAKHPAFGDFPHNGAISPLWFRLLKRGQPLSIPLPFGEVEFLSVGEGRNDYFLYAGQAATGTDGKILVTYGLDLLADTPEGTHLLDQMIDYVGSDAFRPKATIDIHQYVEDLEYREIALSRLNGWSRTISSPTQYTGDAYIIGRGTLRYMHFDKPSEVIWETKPVAVPESEIEKTHTFYWLFGIGFAPDRVINVRLFLNDKELLPFTANVADRSWELKSGDVKLKYRRLAFMGNESTGILELTVPRDQLTVGKPATLKMTCNNEGHADSWVGILEK